MKKSSKNVAFEFGRIANALEADNSQFIGKELFNEIITLLDHYTEYDFGQIYDYLLQNLPLTTGFINKNHSLQCLWMGDFSFTIEGWELSMSCETLLCDTICLYHVIFCFVELIIMLHLD